MVTTPEQRRCVWCETEFQPKAQAGRGRIAAYCSQKCRSAARYQRGKDSGYEAVKRAKRNAKYVRHPLPRVNRVCEVEGCDAKHVARGMCLSHWAKARRAAGIDGSKLPTISLHAVAWLHSAYAPKVKVVLCKVTVGVVVKCPWCSAGMRATSPEFRICNGCGTSLELNADEVAWLTAEGVSARRAKAVSVA